MQGADPQQGLLRHLRCSARNFSKISGLPEREALAFICSRPHNYCRLVDLSGRLVFRRSTGAHVEQMRHILAERWTGEASASDPLVVELELIVSRLEFGPRMPPLAVRTSRRRALLLAQFSSVKNRADDVLLTIPSSTSGESWLEQFSKPIGVGLELGIGAACCFYIYAATLMFRTQCSACGLLEAGVMASFPPGTWRQLQAITPEFFELSKRLARLML